MTSAHKSLFFPPAEAATASGLVLVGGELRPEWLLDAYRHGIFPWPLIDGCSEVQWWSPNPRAIFELDTMHVSRRLRDTLRSGKFMISSDRDFAGVIHGCASADDRRGHTWLSEDMIAAYTRLQMLGHAHSIEAWLDGKLVGGVYGVAIGGLFAGESMFHYERDASKVTLVCLMRHLVRQGYTLFDIQQLTDHTATLGAVEIPRSQYLRRLATAIELPVQFGAIGEQTQI